MDILQVNFERIYELRKKEGSALSLTNEIIVFDDGYFTDNSFFNLENTPPVRIDARVYLLCKQGEMSLDVDYKTCRLTKGALLRLNGRHIIDNIRLTNDYRGNGLVFSHDFILSIINWVPELRELVTSADRIRPLLKFDDAELQLYVDIIGRLKEKLKAVNHIFYNQIAKIEATDFILELADSFAKKMPDENLNAGKEGRGEEIFRQFMQLVMDNCRQHHEVSFYANELNMTPGNLSRVITTVSGNPPTKWIGDALIAEAKALLRNPDMNVQEVAFELNFGDQSSFGKFFKKHTGLTPVEYKNKMPKVLMF